MLLLCSRPDVLVDAEQIGRIVFLLQRGEALVVVAEGRLDARLAFVVHHEVGIGAGEIERMDRRPIVLWPISSAPAPWSDRDRSRRSPSTRWHRGSSRRCHPCPCDAPPRRSGRDASPKSRSALAACSMWASMAASGSVLTKSPFQYHCRPCRIERVEHALQRRVGDRSRPVDDRLAGAPRESR